MQFCVISPIAGLNQFSTLSKSHLVLAQRKEPEYVEFYKERKRLGDFIILDNGAYETEVVSTDRLIEMAREYNADVVVLPDFPGEPSDKTYHTGMRLVADMGGVPWEWMAVPQGNAKVGSGDVLTCLMRFLDEPLVRWIGLPRNLSYLYSDDPGLRYQLARFIQVSHPGKKVHALGMDRGNYHELWYLNNAGVRTIDSSAPVWRGWLNQSLAHFESWKEAPIEWNAPEIGYENQIRKNLRLCGVKVDNL
jgi:hypothetical protein